MREFKNKTAVITGAGSGIGYAIANKLAMEGMNLVLADIDLERLERIEVSMRTIGVRVLSVCTNVSNAEEVERLADVSYSEFGVIDLLCNNAGVLHVAPILEHTAADWNWVLSVNLFGVIHGVRVFGSRMAAQQTESHIVNTASTAAFNSGPGLAAYKISKHAVFALSEILYHEMKGTNVHVSVLCPGWVDTDIMHSEMHRPKDLKNPDFYNPTNAELNRKRAIESAKNGMSPEEIAVAMFEGLKKNQFHILPDLSFKDKFNARNLKILESIDP